MQLLNDGLAGMGMLCCVTSCFLEILDIYRLAGKLQNTVNFNSRLTITYF